MIQTNVSLKDKNSFQIDAIAKKYVEINSIDQINDLFEYLSDNPDLEYFVLGEGCNTLIPDETDKLIIKNNIKGIEEINEDDSSVILCVGAGESFEDLIEYCITEGYYGLENLIGIPGSVGAAAVGNIGAYGVTQSDYFYAATCFDLKNGEYLSINHTDKECKFEYRNSSLRPYFVCDVFYKLSKIFTPIKTYEDLHSLPEDITARQIADTIKEIRNKKLPDYKNEPNVGSFFKNPIVPISEIEAIIKKAGMVKCYNSEIDGHIKLSAAQLIELSGMKGYKKDKCGVSEKHSLIIINFDGANGKEIEDLANEIENAVLNYCGVHLEKEVKTIDN
jgi:UDP-N-acetylmuramate dehydrogenase